MVGDDGRCDRYIPLQEPAQHGVDSGLGFLGRQFEDPQVILDGTTGALLLQGIVGPAKAAGREHRVPIAIVLERSRLSHEPVNHMTIVNQVFVAAAEPRKSLDQHRAAPHLQKLDLDVNINVFTDQSAGNRVRVVLDADGAPLGDSHLEPAPGVDAPRGQISQSGSILAEPLGPCVVAPGQQLAEEPFVVRLVLEIAAAAEHQRLIDGGLESVMALLDISILMGLADVDGLSLQAIVGQQGTITLVEQITIAKVVHRGGEPIGAVHLGNPSQFPEGVLEPLAEALETLGKADRGGLPIGIGQDEVIDHVIEWLASQGDP